MRNFATIAAVVAIATSQVSMAAPLAHTKRASIGQASAAVPDSQPDRRKKSNTILYALGGLAAVGLVIAIAGGGGGKGGTRPTSP
jgi:hypothetical protein